MKEKSLISDYLLIYPDLKKKWNSYFKLWVHYFLFGRREQRGSLSQLKKAKKIKISEPYEKIPKMKIKTGKKHKNLIIVCAGDQSLHEQWIKKENKKRNWDIMVIQYSDKKDWSKTADYYSKIKGIKFRLISFYEPLLKKLAKHYKYIAVWDDDLLISKGSLSEIFEYAKKNDFYLCQPSLENKNISWKITKHVQGLKHRETNFVEVMCPIMKTELFLESMKIFKINPMGWGIDSIFWPYFIAEKNKKIGIIDKYEIIHTKPPGKGDLKKKDIIPLIKLKGSLNLAKLLESKNIPNKEIKKPKNIKIFKN